jgi:hypothetical protein
MLSEGRIEADAIPHADRAGEGERRQRIEFVQYVCSYFIKRRRIGTDVQIQTATIYGLVHECA